ncbi:MAG TPA: 50S ribosomal protein L1 [Elusimicrobia bacterium]|nr:50S ribosomal protein L1 [Elusimicrobiota bacterium]HBT60413.1 50S ribosomal protein L1 [Elusimicrobiota bacterium]
MGKRIVGLTKDVDLAKLYNLDEAVTLVKKCATAKFDETVELHARLGVDPKQADQQVRGVVSLPHGLGKTKKVAVVTQGEKQRDATAAGADVVGGADLVDQISKGFLDFDILVATPDMMKDLSKLGKVLGPKGLMPNPKSGTVTMDVGKTVKELKAGRVEYKVDDYGIIHVPVGKASFEPAKLAGNVKTVMEALIKAKPSSSKGIYLMSVTLSSTMGPGVKLDPSQKY